MLACPIRGFGPVRRNAAEGRVAIPGFRYRIVTHNAVMSYHRTLREYSLNITELTRPVLT
ncbi:hypothetical protein ACTXT7_004275 [Hymenolepis weldensis]